MTMETPSVRVVKIGGRAQSSAALPGAIAAAWRAAPGALCLVHGGGDEVSALQRQLGRQPTFVGGRRVTSDDDIALLRMTLSGVINKRLVAQLGALGLPALGISGEDAGLLAARPLDARLLGRAGAVARVDASLRRHLLHGGYLPVISPLARDASDDHAGAALNVNGDDAAAAIAIALRAHELLLVADVPGVLVRGEPAGTMEIGEAAAAVADGIASGGMAAKLQAAVAALNGGVERVRIGDVGALADAERGTVLLPSRSLV
jgi:acetylglutamate kinase